MNLLIKPLKLIFYGLLYKRLIQLHHYIKTNYKKLKSIPQENEERVLLKQNFFNIAMVIFIIFITLFHLTKETEANVTNEDITKTVMANLISSEFGKIEGQELIQEGVDYESVSPQERSTNSFLKAPQGGVNVATSSDSRKNLLEQEIAYYQRNTLNQQDTRLKTDQATSTQTQTEDVPEETTRTEKMQYQVKSGDTVSTIATKFGVSANTIIWENNLGSQGFIKPGDTLTILPVSGVTHTVTSGETLSYISNLYGVEIEKINKYNDINNYNITTGQELIIPGGEEISSSSEDNSESQSSSQTEDNEYNSGVSVIQDLVKNEQATEETTSNKMHWPAEGHRITQYYKWDHKGLDIADNTGTALMASDSGTVVYAGWTTGYGYNVLINHGGGKKTRYAHASKIYVSSGEKVSKGETIAAMGSTGWSTGPHIHFEVIINGVKYNPLNYIK